MAVQAPSIPLTLRGMRRPRHRPRRSARLSFSLLSVLALVVFACLPALAQAECTDSSCAEYEVEIPTSDGKDKNKNKSGATTGANEPSAGTSNETGGESPSGEESSEEAEESKGGGVPGKDNGGGNPGNNGGSPGGDKPTEGKEGLDSGQAVESPTQQGQAASSSDGGGSSPLVPILIAVAVLAAISIGAVIYRQRRQGSDGSGSPVSPNA
jgi:cobalamin biosynthesis Mg chelatase CobN